MSWIAELFAQFNYIIWGRKIELLITVSNAYSRKKPYRNPKSKDFSTLENESESDLIHSWCSEVPLLLVFQMHTCPHSFVKEQ